MESKKKMKKTLAGLSVASLLASINFTVLPGPAIGQSGCSSCSGSKTEMVDTKPKVSTAPPKKPPAKVKKIDSTVKSVAPPPVETVPKKKKPVVSGDAVLKAVIPEPEDVDLTGVAEKKRIEIDSTTKHRLGRDDVESVDREKFYQKGPDFGGLRNQIKRLGGMVQTVTGTSTLTTPIDPGGPFIFADEDECKKVQQSFADNVAFVRSLKQIEGAAEDFAGKQLAASSALATAGETMLNSFGYGGLLAEVELTSQLMGSVVCPAAGGKKKGGELTDPGGVKIAVGGGGGVSPPPPGKKKKEEDNPVEANIDWIRVEGGQSKDVEVLANDSYDDGFGSLTWLRGGERNGSFDEKTGKASFDAPEHMQGSRNMRYKLTDTDDDSDTSVVKIIVKKRKKIKKPKPPKPPKGGGRGGGGPFVPGPCLDCGDQLANPAAEPQAIAAKELAQDVLEGSVDAAAEELIPNDVWQKRFDAASDEFQEAVSRGAGDTMLRRAEQEIREIKTQRQNVVETLVEEPTATVQRLLKSVGEGGGNLPVHPLLTKKDGPMAQRLWHAVQVPEIQEQVKKISNELVKADGSIRPETMASVREVYSVLTNHNAFATKKGGEVSLSSDFIAAKTEQVPLTHIKAGYSDTGFDRSKMRASFAGESKQGSRLFSKLSHLKEMPDIGIEPDSSTPKESKTSPTAFFKPLAISSRADLLQGRKYDSPLPLGYAVQPQVSTENAIFASIADLSKVTAKGDAFRQRVSLGSTAATQILEPGKSRVDLALQSISLQKQWLLENKQHASMLAAEQVMLPADMQVAAETIRQLAAVLPEYEKIKKSASLYGKGQDAKQVENAAAQTFLASFIGKQRLAAMQQISGYGSNKTIGTAMRGGKPVREVALSKDSSLIELRPIAPLDKSTIKYHDMRLDVAKEMNAKATLAELRSRNANELTRADAEERMAASDLQSAAMTTGNSQIIKAAVEAPALVRSLNTLAARRVNADTKGIRVNRQEMFDRPMQALTTELDKRTAVLQGAAKNDSIIDASLKKYTVASFKSKNIQLSYARDSKKEQVVTAMMGEAQQRYSADLKTAFLHTKPAMTEQADSILSTPPAATDESEDLEKQLKDRLAGFGVVQKFASDEEMRDYAQQKIGGLGIVHTKSDLLDPEYLKKQFGARVGGMGHFQEFESDEQMREFAQSRLGQFGMAHTKADLNDPDYLLQLYKDRFGGMGWAHKFESDEEYAEFVKSRIQGLPGNVFTCQDLLDRGMNRDRLKSMMDYNCARSKKNFESDANYLKRMLKEHPAEYVKGEDGSIHRKSGQELQADREKAQLESGEFYRDPDTGEVKRKNYKEIQALREQQLIDSGEFVRDPKTGNLVRSDSKAADQIKRKVAKKEPQVTRFAATDAYGNPISVIVEVDNFESFRDAVEDQFAKQGLLRNERGDWVDENGDVVLAAERLSELDQNYTDSMEERSPGYSQFIAHKPENQRPGIRPPSFNEKVANLEDDLRNSMGYSVSNIKVGDLTINKLDVLPGESVSDAIARYLKGSKKYAMSVDGDVVDAATGDIVALNYDIYGLDDKYDKKVAESIFGKGNAGFGDELQYLAQNGTPAQKAKAQQIIANLEGKILQMQQINDQQQSIQQKIAEAEGDSTLSAREKRNLITGYNEQMGKINSSKQQLEQNILDNTNAANDSAIKVVENKLSYAERDVRRANQQVQQLADELTDLEEQLLNQDLTPYQLRMLTEQREKLLGELFEANRNQQLFTQELDMEERQRVGSLVKEVNLGNFFVDPMENKTFVADKREAQTVVSKVEFVERDGKKVAIYRDKNGRILVDPTGKEIVVPDYEGRRVQDNIRRNLAKDYVPVVRKKDDYDKAFDALMAVNNEIAALESKLSGPDAPKLQGTERARLRGLYKEQRDLAGRVNAIGNEMNTFSQTLDMQGDEVKKEIIETAIANYNDYQDYVAQWQKGEFSIDYVDKDGKKQVWQKDGKVDFGSASWVDENGKVQVWKSEEQKKYEQAVKEWEEAQLAKQKADAEQAVAARAAQEQQQKDHQVLVAKKIAEARDKLRTENMQNIERTVRNAQYELSKAEKRLAEEKKRLVGLKDDDPKRKAILADIRKAERLVEKAKMDARIAGAQAALSELGLDETIDRALKKAQREAEGETGLGSIVQSMIDAIPGANQLQATVIGKTVQEGIERLQAAGTRYQTLAEREEAIRKRLAELSAQGKDELHGTEARKLQNELGKLLVDKVAAKNNLQTQQQRFDTIVDYAQFAGASPDYNASRLTLLQDRINKSGKDPATVLNQEELREYERRKDMQLYHDQYAKVLHKVDELKKISERRDAGDPTFASDYEAKGKLSRGLTGTELRILHGEYQRREVMMQVLASGAADTADKLKVVENWMVDSFGALGANKPLHNNKPTRQFIEQIGFLSKTEGAFSYLEEAQQRLQQRKNALTAAKEALSKSNTQENRDEVHYLERRVSLAQTMYQQAESSFKDAYGEDPLVGFALEKQGQSLIKGRSFEDIKNFMTDYRNGSIFDQAPSQAQTGDGMAIEQLLDFAGLGMADGGAVTPVSQEVLDVFYGSSSNNTGDFYNYMNLLGEKGYMEEKNEQHQADQRQKLQAELARAQRFQNNNETYVKGAEALQQKAKELESELNRRRNLTATYGQHLADLAAEKKRIERGLEAGNLTNTDRWDKRLEEIRLESGRYRRYQKNNTFHQGRVEQRYKIQVADVIDKLPKAWQRDPLIAEQERLARTMQMLEVKRELVGTETAQSIQREDTARRVKAFSDQLDAALENDDSEKVEEFRAKIADVERNDGERSYILRNRHNMLRRQQIDMTSSNRQDGIGPVYEYELRDMSKKLLDIDFNQYVSVSEDIKANYRRSAGVTAEAAVRTNVSKPDAGFASLFADEFFSRDTLDRATDPVKLVKGVAGSYVGFAEGAYSLVADTAQLVAGAAELTGELVMVHTGLSDELGDKTETIVTLGENWDKLNLSGAVRMEMHKYFTKMAVADDPYAYGKFGGRVGFELLTNVTPGGAVVTAEKGLLTAAKVANYASDMARAAKIAGDIAEAARLAKATAKALDISASGLQLSAKGFTKASGGLTAAREGVTTLRKGLNEGAKDAFREFLTSPSGNLYGSELDQVINIRKTLAKADNLLGKADAPDVSPQKSKELLQQADALRQKAVRDMADSNEYIRNSVLSHRPDIPNLADDINTSFIEKSLLGRADELVKKADAPDLLPEQKALFLQEANKLRNQAQDQLAASNSRVRDAVFTGKKVGADFADQVTVKRIQKNLLGRADTLKRQADAADISPDEKLLLNREAELLRAQGVLELGAANDAVRKTVTSARPETQEALAALQRLASAKKAEGIAAAKIDDAATKLKRLRSGDAGADGAVTATPEVPFDERKTTRLTVEDLLNDPAFRSAPTERFPVDPIDVDGLSTTINDTPTVITRDGQLIALQPADGAIAPPVAVLDPPISLRYGMDRPDLSESPRLRTMFADVEARARASQATQNWDEFQQASQQAGKLSTATSIFKNMTPAERGRAHEVWEILLRIRRENPQLRNMDPYDLASNLMLRSKAAQAPEEVVAVIASMNNVDISVGQLARAANISTPNAEGAIRQAWTREAFMNLNLDGDAKIAKALDEMTFQHGAAQAADAAATAGKTTGAANRLRNVRTAQADEAVANALDGLTRNSGDDALRLANGLRNQLRKSNLPEGMLREGSERALERVAIKREVLQADIDEIMQGLTPNQPVEAAKLKKLIDLQDAVANLDKQQQILADLVNSPLVEPRMVDDLVVYGPDPDVKFTVRPLASGARPKRPASTRDIRSPQELAKQHPDIIPGQASPDRKGVQYDLEQQGERLEILESYEVTPGRKEFLLQTGAASTKESTADLSVFHGKVKQTLDETSGGVSLRQKITSGTMEDEGVRKAIAEFLNEHSDWPGMAGTLPVVEPEIAVKLMEFRNWLFTHLTQKFKDIEPTGSVGKMSNDLDFSTFGDAPGALLKQIDSYLANEIVVAKGAKKGLDNWRQKMHMDVFTNSNLIHVYDEVADEGLRKALALDRDLFEFAELAELDGLKHSMQPAAFEKLLGDVRPGTSVADVQKQIDKAFGNVSVADKDVLLDKLDEALKAFRRTKDPRYASDVSRYQIMVNLVTADAYRTPGGVKQAVTYKEGLVPFAEPITIRLPSDKIRLGPKRKFKNVNEVRQELKRIKSLPQSIENSADILALQRKLNALESRMPQVNEVERYQSIMSNIHFFEHKMDEIAQKAKDVNNKYVNLEALRRYETSKYLTRVFQEAFELDTMDTGANSLMREAQYRLMRFYKERGDLLKAFFGDESLPLSPAQLDELEQEAATFIGWIRQKNSELAVSARRQASAAMEGVTKQSITAPVTPPKLLYSPEKLDTLRPELKNIVTESELQLQRRGLRAGRIVNTPATRMTVNTQQAADSSGPAVAAAAMRALHPGSKVTEREFVQWSLATGKGYQSNAALQGTTAKGLSDMLAAQIGVKAYSAFLALDDIVVARQKNKEVLVHATFDSSIADAGDHWLIIENVDNTSVTLGDPWYGLSVRLPRDEFEKYWQQERTVVVEQ